MVSANWLKDIIQEDCDSEDKERQKVSVREFDLPEGLADAENAQELLQWVKETKTPMYLVSAIFQAGKEWAFKQGVTKDGLVAAYDNGYLRVYTTILDKEDGIKFGDKVIVQIRKK